MRKWFTANLGLKLLSVLFAIVLWIIVVNIDDPVTTKSFKNIPVTFVNEAVLSESGMVYQVLDNTDTVTISVRAKRSVLESLSTNDFSAVADFAERISETSVPVKVTALKHEDDIADITLMNNTVKISVEEEIEKEIPVNLKITGNAAEGMTVGKTTVSPEKVTVSGPQSIISNVESMQVVLDAGNASQDISAKIKGRLIGKGGGEISDARIMSSVSEFQVNAKLLHTKSVDLDFSVEGEVAEGYRYVDMSYMPTTILLAGDLEDLDKVSTITFPSSELSLNGASGDVVKKVNAGKYIPSGLTLVNSEDENITVTLHVIPLAVQQLSLPVSRIDVLNTPSGMDMDFTEVYTVELTLRGLSSDFTDLSQADEISMSVDLKGLSEGVHRLPVKVTMNNNLELVNVSAVYVRLTSRNEAYPTSAPAEHSDDGSVTNTGGSTGENL